MNRSFKSITLLGMSGVGKSHFSMRLAEWGWRYFSCDVFIGEDELKLGVTPDDLSALSKYLGKVGDPAKGGLDKAEFLKRQKIYYDAECASLERAREIAQNGGGNFVNDAAGSLCEILEEDLIGRLGRATLFVYLKANEEENKKVLERARLYPKPLLFPPQRFEKWLKEYLDLKDLRSEAQMEPDDFSRWVFPKLFEARLPKYERLAKLYGVTISSDKIHGVKSEDEFLELIAHAL